MSRREASLATFHLTGRSCFELNGYTIVYQLVSTLVSLTTRMSGPCSAP